LLVSSSKRKPSFLQNLAECGFSMPHWGQRLVVGATAADDSIRPPHLGQNFGVPLSTALQL
jgi:hypothetical protein